MLGKRKRSAAPASELPSRKSKKSTPPPDDDAELRARFQRAFEARFKPLPNAKTKKAPSPPPELPEDEEDEEWSGVESDAEPEIPVIELKAPSTNIVSSGLFSSSKQDLKAFLSGKAPTSSSTVQKPISAPKKAAESTDVEDSAQHLKNDLALQRLLSESHLLSGKGNTSQSLAATGKTRHKALDLRLQALGAKTSVFKQEKMPMSHRKGIVKKTTEREVKRRSDAKEGGIILEKEKRKVKFTGKRERAVGAPTVGKFRHGLLSLSKRDVGKIESTGERPMGKKGRS
ncbi:hypothetical protein E2P81_ATG06893 [Venturia nashicola]|uniref:Uncharacterized protein n=1 Tax=Venturia nashicola TaxID=86259 RepID=A0A4Z1NY96_9PEZI|nr:hypothetical protein E6O75_ATG07063 [Venturia nashicola]TLD30240.1 hypothetical protein E2P81_ATG06893 [Venturia nashicola]